MTHKKYEIKTVLDFTKIPKSKRLICFMEFNDWLDMMIRAQKLNSPLIPIDKFVWIDDKKRNITVSISTGQQPKESL